MLAIAGVGALGRSERRQALIHGLYRSALAARLHRQVVVPFCRQGCGPIRAPSDCGNRSGGYP